MASQDWTFQPEIDISMPTETKNTFVHYNDLGTLPSPRARSDTECDYASMQVVLDTKIHLASGAKSKSRPGKRLRDRMKQRNGAKKVDALDQRSAACVPSNHKIFVALGVCIALLLSLTWLALTRMHARQLAVIDGELRAKETIIDELNKTLLLEKERQDCLLGQEADEKLFSKTHPWVEHVQTPIWSPRFNQYGLCYSISWLCKDKGFDYDLLQVLLVAFASGFCIQSFAAILRSPEGSSTGAFAIVVSTIFIIKCTVTGEALEPLMCGAAPSFIQFAVSIVAKLFVPSDQDLIEDCRVCLTGYSSGSSYGRVTLFECGGTAQVRMDDGTQMSVLVSSLSRAPKPGGASMMGIIKGLLVSLPIWCFGPTALTKALAVVALAFFVLVLLHLICAYFLYWRACVNMRPLYQLDYLLHRQVTEQLAQNLYQLDPNSFTPVPTIFSWLVCFFIVALTPVIDVDGATRILLSIFTGILGMIFSNASLGAVFDWQAHTMCGWSVEKNPANPASCQALSW